MLTSFRSFSASISHIMTDHADSDAALAAALQAEEDALALAARRDVLAARDTAAELAGQVEYGRTLAAKVREGGMWLCVLCVCRGLEDVGGGLGSCPPGARVFPSRFDVSTLPSHSTSTPPS